MTRLSKAGLKVRAKKYNFAMTKLEYLRCYVTREGIKPAIKKVQAMLNIKSTRAVKQL